MDPHDSPHHNRLWTPWRMRYVGGSARENGCIFCNRVGADDDVRSLILHRGDHSFVIMNLFPYNTGHVMIVPNAHAADIGELDDPTLTEMALVLPPITRSLKRVLRCDGFNIGLNLGAVAGAGVAAHLHQHVVPRWEGDANFMPILAGTMVMPELIPSSYAKVRAELERELLGAERFDILVVSDAGSPSVWLRNGVIPDVVPTPGTPVFRAALELIGADRVEIVGWGGATRAENASIRPALVIRTDGRPGGGEWHAVPMDAPSGHSDMSPPVRQVIDRVRSNLPPWIAASG